MDYRHLFGTAAIILSGAVFVHTLNKANAFPQGPTINLGSNPLFSIGGTISNSTAVIFTAPSDQIMVTTDIILSMHNDSCASDITLSNSSNTLAQFELHSKWRPPGSGAYYGAMSQTQATSIQHAFNSGIPLSVGDSLEITESGNCNIAYTISGYYAQP